MAITVIQPYNISNTGNYTFGNVTGGNLLTGGVVSATGNVTGNYIIGNGSQLTGTVANATYAAAAGTVTTNAQPNITSVGILSSVSVSGDITGGNVLTGGIVSSAGNITGSYFIGNGSQLTNVTASSVAASALTGNTLSSNVVYSSLTSVGTLSTLSVSGNTNTGNLITPGLISAASNVTSSGSVFAAGIVSAAGNIIGNSQLYIGAGAQNSVLTNPVIVAKATGLTYIQASIQNTNDTGSADWVAYADNGTETAAWTDMGMTGSGFNDTAYTITDANDGYLFVQGNTDGAGGNLVLATGDQGTKDIVFATGGFTSAAEKMRFIHATGQFYIETATAAANTTTGALRVVGGAGIGGNVYSGGLISSVGNILAGGNVSGNNISLINGVSAGGNVTGGNIVTGGIITATGNISSAGNVSASYFIGNGSQLTGLPAGYSDANVATYLASGTNSSNIITTANVTGGNLLTSGLVSASANVTGGNILTGGLISATSTITSAANVTGGNILTSGLISATGNLTVGNITTTIANVTTFNSAQGGNVTGTLIATSANAQFINQTNSGGNISAAGNILGNLNLSIAANIIGGNILTGGLVSATGNVTGGNVLTGGLISAASTVTGTSLLGSVVSVSANITGGNILTGGLISATGNVTGGNVNTGTVRNSAGALTISTGSGNINLTPAGNIVLSANTYINNVGYPAQDADAATKQYVDNLVSTAISYHEAVYAATTTTLAATTSGTITYAQPNGAGNGIGATLTTTGSFNLIDTANVQTAGTRILVKNEANAVHNGIYTWSNATVITRSADADEYGAGNPNALGLNDYFFVTGGNVNLGSAWIVDAPSGTITFGTSNISFAQFSQSQVYSANGSAGLSLAGTVFSAKVDNNTTAFDGSGNIIVKASANLTTPNIGAATGTSVSLTANITGGNVLTGGLITATGNVTGGNVLTGGIVSATGTITSSGGTNSTAFAVGNAAVSNVALGFFPTAGTGANMAIRDYSTVTSDMFFDVGMGGSAAGAFKFRTTNAFSSIMTANSAGVFTPGVMSATGRVYGLELNSTQSSGNEGGQINLALAATNTTLSGNVIVDVFQNQLRFYEGGGTNRGAYIDLSSAAAGVGTDLLAGSGGTPGGSNTYVQFNDGGAFGGNAQFTYNKFTNTLTAGIIVSSNNGSGTNFQVGDDAWIGDINAADTIGIRGQQNAANAYIVFGNADSTQLGRTGAGPLTYGGAFSASSNITGGNLLTTGLISATGNVSSAGNISATYYIGNGSQLTGITSYGNSNVAAYLPTYSGNLSANNVSITTSLTGNIASLSGNIIGANLTTSGLISAAGNVTSAANISSGNLLSSALIQGVTVSASGNVVGGNLTTAGLISATSTIRSSANITGANLLTGGLISATGNILATANVSGGNLLTGGLISAAGDIIANNFIGNGATLTSINGSNVAGIVANATYATSAGSATTATTATYVTGLTAANVTTALGSTAVANATYAVSAGSAGSATTATTATTAGTVTTAAQPNITSVGTLSSLTITANTSSGNFVTAGLISAAGNVTGSFIFGNGSQLTGITGTYGNSNVASYLASGTNTSNITTTGNVTGGNILTNGTISAATGVATALTVSAQGNVTGGNLLTGGLISAVSTITSSANINGSNFNGTSISLTGAITTVGLSFNSATFALSAAGNVTGSNVNTAGLVSAASGILSGTTMSAVGNITGGNILATAFYDSNNTTYYIDPSNGATAGNFAGTVNALIFNTTSDRRLKENIKPIGTALQRVMAIDGITYNFINDDLKVRHAGVAAQQLLEVFPEAVTGNEKDTYRVSYGDLVALLIEAIKEQQQQIQDLQNKNSN